MGKTLTRAVCVLGAIATGGGVHAADPPLLLADTSRWPRVTVEWETTDGKTVKLEGERGYKSPADKSPLGKNVDCYVALGGTRLDKGCGDPHGAILRVGLYKSDTKQLFFDGIREGGQIT